MQQMQQMRRHGTMGSGQVEAALRVLLAAGSPVRAAQYNHNCTCAERCQQTTDNPNPLQRQHWSQMARTWQQISPECSCTLHLAWFMRSAQH
ncbi:hypothetical protein OEZ86_002507 [Tetradesmus obliquus]|nr:hypothetical protein OEZ86_002507 [Tetradesmus obliquus]